jgi:hypothetical protein
MQISMSGIPDNGAATCGNSLIEGSCLHVTIGVCSPGTVISAIVVRIGIPVIIPGMPVPAWMPGVIGVSPGIIPDSPVESGIHIDIYTIPAVIITIPAIPVRIINNPGCCIAGTRDIVTRNANLCLNSFFGCRILIIILFLGINFLFFIPVFPGC